MSEEYWMEEPKQTTQADIGAMTDEKLLQEAAMIRTAVRMNLAQNLSERWKLQLFALSTWVAEEISKRGLKILE